MTDTLSPDDLDAYLRRIGHAGPLRADRDTLAALHGAHVAAIAFENLDVRWGKGIRLDLASLVAKLVRGGRGGYCFEQNGLFAAVLRTLGFDVQALGARVRLRATRTLPRTHQLLLVTLDGEPTLADVGFGAQTLLEPVPLAARAFDQAAWRYELGREGERWVLRMVENDVPVDLYAFTLEPQLPPDLEMANWYVSTHPASGFVQTLTVQRATRVARELLRNRTYTVDRGRGDVTIRELGDDAILALLRDGFGLDLPADARLPLPAIDALPPPSTHSTERPAWRNTHSDTR